MKQNIWRMTSRFLSLIVIISLIVSYFTVDIFAEESTDSVVVVSLGDSYSSGEGIEPFYGQDKAWAERVKDEDWLAHRSTKSWPSLLKIPKADGTTSQTMSNYKVTDTAPSEEYKWYFAAVSGAVTSNINYIDESADPSEHKYYHKKEVRKKEVYDDTLKVEWLPPQLEIFNQIESDDTVDYVTMTIGGNDVGFSDIVVSVAVEPAWIYSSLDKTFEDLWKEENISKIESKLEKTYKRVSEAAGEQAHIIIAGYPELLDDVNGGGAHVNRSEAQTVNKNVIKFNNDVIKATVEKLAAKGMRIHYVDVVDKFNGHEAYTDDAYINGIDVFKKDNDLNRKATASSYSVHPNAQGAEAYAECVNAKIAEIENAGTLSGKICKASDRTTPVTNATIQIISDGSTKTLTPDSNGNYSIDLPVGTYLVKVTADGYIEFNAYATIESRQTVYMETFLMVEGEETDIGEAIGTITNALTGNGIEGVTLDVRSGWNNADSGDILTTVTTTASGDYTVTLPIGNYTLCASKAGYISTMINVVVQPDVCTTKNASMTPIISGDNFRIVLTWGASPSDLDSHVVGALSDGNSFHVYFGDKSEYDGEIEVCNLDVDDTSSYGPETITLNTTTADPYYYYIYNYSSSSGMITSEAQINVYQGENLVATFNVPTDQADARYWNVFAIVNGELVISNTITSSADLSYANGVSEVSTMAIDVEVDVEADMAGTPKESIDATS